MEEAGVKQDLSESSLEKVLGILVATNFKSTEQCNKSAKKAMRVLGLIKRNFRNLVSQSLKTLYCSFVRPHMEHCVQAWSPYLNKDVKTLERVQRRASQLVPVLRNLSYEDRFKKLTYFHLNKED